MANESWRSRKTLILSRTDMMGLVTPAEYVACVEQAYRMHGEGRYYMDPKGHIVLDRYPGVPAEEPAAVECDGVADAAEPIVDDARRDAHDAQPFAADPLLRRHLGPQNRQPLLWECTPLLGERWRTFCKCDTFLGK